MITLLTGQNDSKSYRGRNYGGIRITITCVNATANDALTQAELLVQNLLVQATLRRGGVEHQICSLTGDNFAAAVYDNVFDFFNPANTANEGYQLTTVAAVGAFETGQVVVTIPFGSPVDCSSTGEIILSAQASSGIFASTLNQNTSNVTIDLEECAGAEIGLPRILVQPIQANDTNPSFYPGDGVRSLFFVNRDKAGITTANQVLSSVNVTTDERVQNMSYNQLLAYRNKDFTWNEISNDRAQTFCLLSYNPEKVYFGVTVNASTVGANVTASKNYWVAWQLLPSAQSVLAGKNYQAQTVQKVSRYINQIA